MKNMIITSILALTVTLVAAQPSLKAGMRHLENENYAAALEQFTAIAKMDPKNGTIYYYIGEVSYRQELHGDAEKAYKKGLEINQQCAECKVGLGKILLDKNKKEEAAVYFESAARLDRKNPEIFAMIGDAYLYGKNMDLHEAIHYLETAKSMDASKARYWAHLGDAYYKQGDNGEAVTHYEFAIQKDPTLTSAYVSSARIWMAAKAYDSAVSLLKKAITLSPEDALPYKDLVEVYIITNKYDSVTPLLAKYITLIGNDVAAKVRYVKFLTFQAKDYDRAIDEGEKLLKTNPEQYTLHRWLAWAYGEKSMANESYQHSKCLFEDIGKAEGREAFPSDYEYWAKAALLRDSIDEAAHIYRKYLELDSSRTHEIYGLLAKKYFDAKNYSQAIAYYNRKNEVKPIVYPDTYYLGFSYYYTKQDSIADSMFIRVLNVIPENASIWLYRARIASEIDYADTTHQTFSAKPLYEKFIVLAIVDPEKNKKGLIEAYRYLGQYHIQQNETNLALEYFEKSLALDATNEEVINFIKILKGQN